MAIILDDNFVTEDILNKNNEKMGELTFNPNDSRILQRLSEIINIYNEAQNDVKKLGKINLSNEPLKTLEDFEKTAEEFVKINETFNIEISAFDKVFNGLSEIFGEENVKLFTRGTKDITLLIPLINTIQPYVEKARRKMVNGYLKNNDSDVME